MLETKSKRRKINNRSVRAAIIAENVAVLYLLFFLIFFPLLDFAAMGLRAFFLWYTCDQAAMAGAKGSQWSTGNATGTAALSTTYYTSIQTQALTTATTVAGMFSGITINGTPQLSVILSGIQHSDTTNNQTSVATVPLSASQLPLTSNSTPPTVDTSQYIPILRVQINGTIQPFMYVPFFFPVPGLNASFPMTIKSDQQIENAMALNS